MLSRMILTELKLLYRRRQELVNPLLFFVMVCALFPLAVSPDSEQLKAIAPGIIWVAAMLASLLSLDAMFRHDFDDGTLEQMLFSGQSFYLLVLVKVACYWSMTGLPLTMVSPLLATMLFLPTAAISVLMLSLLLGTAVLCLAGAIGAALTVSLKRAGVVIALLVLPLFMPILIFGSSAVVAASQGLPATGQLAWLAALLMFGIILAPCATAAAIRISIACD